jgi:hypothetical protein
MAAQCRRPSADFPEGPLMRQTGHFPERSRGVRPQRRRFYDATPRLEIRNRGARWAP